MQYVFKAYKTTQDWKDSNPYFTKKFTDHQQMKRFSAAHSFEQKQIYPDYVSDYETQAERRLSGPDGMSTSVPFPSFKNKKQ